MKSQKQQGGMFLLEALIAILIFSLGILGMVAMGSAAVASQSDAQYRSEAASFANELAGKMALNVQGASASDIPTNVQTFAHQPISAGYCNFAGDASTNPVVLGWLDRVSGAVAGTPGLPGSTTTSESVAVDTSQPNYNVVTITICWKPPSTSATLAPWHREMLMTYIPNQQ